MSDSQMSAAALDRKRNPVPMIAGDFGDLTTLDLVVANDVAVALDTAVDYPERPVVVGWALYNYNIGNTHVAYISDADVDIEKGFFLNKGTGGTINQPGTLLLMTDPGKTFIRQNSGGPLTYRLMLLGKNLEAPVP